MKRNSKSNQTVDVSADLVETKSTSKNSNGKTKKNISTNGLEFSDELDMRELLKVLSEVKKWKFYSAYAG